MVKYRLEHGQYVVVFCFTYIYVEESWNWFEWIGSSLEITNRMYDSPYVMFAFGQDLNFLAIPLATIEQWKCVLLLNQSGRRIAWEGLWWFFIFLSTNFSNYYVILVVRLKSKTSLSLQLLCLSSQSQDHLISPHSYGGYKLNLE